MRDTTHDTTNDGRRKSAHSHAMQVPTGDSTSTPVELGGSRESSPRAKRVGKGGHREYGILGAPYL